ncbi:nucleolar protein 9 [Condylostylus longicornis]|uniref:nucleolar protein 9 n=1 Tax=Condylostylus longicornis TaxID=2530218 RepID=UPI00244D9FB0|nr:nucleolar protein 9 [Condylostylus longicornis]
MEIESEINHNEKNPRNKFRKNNKNNKFLRNAKGFGKRGSCGRGTNIPDDVYQYLINILDAMKNGFESLEEKCSMADNVFDNCVDHEVHLASNQVGSKALEFLIGFVSENHLTNFMQKFSENFRPICSDSFASHVLQKMVEIAFLRSKAYKNMDEEDKINNAEEPITKKIKVNDCEDETYNTKTKFSKNHRKECSEFVLKVGKFLLNNLEDFIWDTHASHIMRTCILCLSGIYSKKEAFDQNNISNILSNANYYQVPSEWIEIAKEFSQRIELWPQFSELPYSDLTSGFLSILCLALKQIDKNFLKHFGRKILIEAFIKIEENDEKKEIKDGIDNENESANKAQDELNMAKVFYSSSSIRLLETLIILSGPKLFTQLYAMLFPGKILPLSLDRTTNFAVQKIIENVKEKTDFESIFEELKDSFEDILKIGHTGVVSALSSTCLRLQTKQGAFIKAIQTALHTIDSKEKSDQIFKCLLKLKPYEIAIQDKTQFVHLHGSLIVQNILRFNKPIFLVNSILNFSSIELVAILNTQKGSFIADVFLESKFIGEKSREKFIRHMEGTYIDLAITKSGSRVIEKFIESSNESQKTRIVKELSEKENQLNGTFFGRLIFKKFRISTYKLSPAEWKTSFNKTKKAEKLFKDILEK